MHRQIKHLLLWPAHQTHLIRGDHALLLLSAKLLKLLHLRHSMVETLVFCSKATEWTAGGVLQVHTLTIAQLMMRSRRHHVGVTFRANLLNSLHTSLLSPISLFNLGLFIR